ncbi:MAG: RraA family protein [Verrucomicrobia bacterium]|nr:RraA family protein [Verrucomicrobiota bacterium]
MISQPQAADTGNALATLYTAVVCDVLDGLGFRQQTLPASIRPLTPARAVCGRVFPARAATVDSTTAEPYKLEIAAVEAMAAGDVLVVDAGEERTCGFWGELLTTACVAKRVRGVVMTACTRDMWKIKDLNFPIFGIGYHPADSKGRADMVAIAEPIEIAGVKIRHGDWILGDEDGVVVIPAEALKEAVRLAREKVAGENLARADLARGIPMGEVFRKHGIL